MEVDEGVITAAALEAATAAAAAGVADPAADTGNLPQFQPLKAQATVRTADVGSEHVLVFFFSFYLISLSSLCLLSLFSLSVSPL